MTYVLYGDKGSGAFCVEAALAEAGASYGSRTISIHNNEQKSPAYLAVNPSGKIPALKLPDGSVVTETAALLLLVAERHGNLGERELRARRHDAVVGRLGRARERRRRRLHGRIIAVAVGA